MATTTGPLTEVFACERCVADLETQEALTAHVVADACLPK